MNWYIILNNKRVFKANKINWNFYLNHKIFLYIFLLNYSKELINYTYYK
jgi:hypothetical protein